MLLLLLPLRFDMLDPASYLHLSLVVILVVIDDFLHTQSHLLVVTECLGELGTSQLDS
jgi:hypothetical protein